MSDPLMNTKLDQRLKEVCTRDLLLECVVSHTLKTPEEWGRALELAESDIRSIRVNYANHANPCREMLFQTLWMWYQQKGQAATVEELLYATYRLEEQTTSEAIRDYIISDVHVPQNEKKLQRRNNPDFQDHLVSLFTSARLFEDQPETECFRQPQFKDSGFQSLTSIPHVPVTLFPGNQSREQTAKEIATYTHCWEEHGEVRPPDKEVPAAQVQQASSDAEHRSDVEREVVCRGMGGGSYMFHQIATINMEKKQLQDELSKVRFELDQERKWRQILQTMSQCDKWQHEKEMREKENTLRSLENTCSRMAQQLAELKAELETCFRRRHIQEAAGKPPTLQRHPLACYEDPGQMYPQGTAGNLPPSKQEQTVITIQTPANGIVTFSTEAPIVIEPDGTIRSLQHR